MARSLFLAVSFLCLSHFTVIAWDKTVFSFNLAMRGLIVGAGKGLAEPFYLSDGGEKERIPRVEMLYRFPGGLN